MKKTLLFLYAFLAFYCTSQQVQTTRILFILDASNSMNASWGAGTTRIQAAKEILAKCVDSLSGSANLEIALRVYGHQSLVTSTYQDCQDTKLEVPFAKDNFVAVRNRIKTIEAKGTTPIARSLEAAAGDFPDKTTRNIIILITDGLEACDNDPCIIAQKLRSKEIGITPFVIGLGLDLSYLEQFKCIGSYAEAQSKQSFSLALKDILGKIVLNTTVQVNLNDSFKKPSETDVTMHFYKAGTTELKYTMIHTINRFGNPDTIILDPSIKYDLVVNTLPKVVKSSISIVKNSHNTIVVDCPQGFIQTNLSNTSKTHVIEARIIQKDSTSTLNTQYINQKDKYLIGTYKLEILTIPRIYRTVNVSQSSTTFVTIDPPGQLNYSSSKTFVAQIFLTLPTGKQEWVYNLDNGQNKGNLALQPGNYTVVYRQKLLKATMYTIEKEFRITSNKITTINF